MVIAPLAAEICERLRVRQTGGIPRPTAAFRAISEGYVAAAFRFARAAAPSAELYYNDCNTAKLLSTLRLVNPVRERGAAVDAIGIQGHWHLDFPDVAIIRDAILRCHRRIGESKDRPRRTAAPDTCHTSATDRTIELSARPLSAARYRGRGQPLRRTVPATPVPENKKAGANRSGP